MLKPGEIGPSRQNTPRGVFCPGVCDVGCPGGVYTRTSNTSALYTLQAVQQTYFMQPYNNSGVSDTYTFVVLFP